ncbi:MAG: peptidylprolyl isomerase [Aromatoleum sp.]|jgi:peptidyl-prolyl cis-trans isomerase C|uniref:peptidylprolyl isomerase n=1 Tax=Aromatoleum sp. TaxID=2307007 RepID=UPI00289600DC|nr:peptidylprolyl isomerase [Aromatoleum sp.]MDT3671079.1 peptidylprolyl isomerase [Aromatoleum sp.]
MKRFPSRLALGLMAGLIAHAAGAAAPAATVNGTAIPANRVDVMMNEQRAQGAPDSPQLRDAVREELVRREVLAQEAVKKGLDKKAETQAQMDLARQAVLIRAYIQDYVKANPISEADLRKEYEGIKSQMGSKEYKPRHVLVETEDEAKAIIAKLRGGEKFETLAKQSKDPGSKDQGGELGWSNPGMFVKPFSDAMVKLEKGQYTTTPVKSDFGYHVIQLDDVRDMKAPAFEEVKPQLEQRLQQQKVEKHVADLRAKAKVQ